MSEDRDPADTTYGLRPIGRVESPLTDGRAAPKQGDEGAPVLDVKPALRALDER